MAFQAGQLFINLPVKQLQTSIDFFTAKTIVDASTQTEVITAISASSRAEVDELVNKTLAAGGQPFNDPVDHGFMYNWSLQDVDGHLWEVMYRRKMDRYRSGQASVRGTGAFFDAGLSADVNIFATYSLHCPYKLWESI